MEKTTNNKLGGFFMKKFILIMFLILIIILLLSPSESKEMRIRVIANSNSSFDQSIKYEVVEKLKKTLKDTNDLNIIKADAEYVISKSNCDYVVNVNIKQQKYDTKYINNKVIPGGVYKTLVVEIGKAQGKNFWSIIYPEFFNVSFEDVNSGEVEFGWWISDILKG